MRKLRLAPGAITTSTLRVTTPPAKGTERSVWISVPALPDTVRVTINVTDCPAPIDEMVKLQKRWSRPLKTPPQLPTPGDVASPKLLSVTSVSTTLVSVVAPRLLTRY